MKKNSGNGAKKQPAPETFRVTDAAVGKVLRDAESSGNKSAVINEALRLYGGEAVINVLKDEIAAKERQLSRVLQARG